MSSSVEDPVLRGREERAVKEVECLVQQSQHIPVGGVFGPARHDLLHGEQGGACHELANEQSAVPREPRADCFSQTIAVPALLFEPSTAQYITVCEWI